MGGGDGRHAGIESRAYRCGFFLGAQLVEYHHIRRQTPYRLLDSLRFRIAPEYVAAEQRQIAGQLAALVHNRYPPTVLRQLARQIAQKAALAA